jgi:diguanylate cyclase (GGDEF)-like protein
MSNLFDQWEPPLGRLEDDYRRHFLARDIEQSRLAGLLASVGMLIYLIADFYFFRFSPLFVVLVLARLVQVTMNFGVSAALRHERRPAAVDRLTLLNELGLVALSLLVFGTRPTEIWQGDVFGVVIVYAIYTLVPQPLKYRLLVAGLYTVGMLGVMFLTRTSLSPVEQSAGVAGFFAANLIGFLVSVWLNNYRRQQFRALHEEQEARRTLEHLATTDSLTGVLNRRSFIEAAENEVNRFRRYGRPFAVLVMDLDNFKRINDTYGHLAGDRALLTFTSMARRMQRATDQLGRLGGEEFGLLLPETSLSQALKVAERLRAECAAQVITLEGATFGITLSGGVAGVTPEDEKLDDVMRRADAALYRAKEAGRDRVEAGERVEQ